MKLVGQFALGGFGIGAGISLVGFGMTAALRGFGSLDVLWLVFGVVIGGLTLATAGAVLALFGLLLQRVFPRPAAPAMPPAATDNTVWPPPPVTPLPRAQPFEDSAPE